jgi:hypothetical protein
MQGSLWRCPEPVDCRTSEADAEKIKQRGLDPWIASFVICHRLKRGSFFVGQVNRESFHFDFLSANKKLVPGISENEFNRVGRQ